MAFQLPSLVTSPWHSEQTFSQVYESIFKQNFDQNEAQGTASLIWSRNQLLEWLIKNPTSPDVIEYEATASLVSAIVKERCDKMSVRPGDESFTEYDLASLYATAIIKFVDALSYYQITEVDGRRCIIRTWKKSDRGIKWTANKLGVPGWIIECRHDACHSSTPPLSLLRQASYIAKEWLDKNFWSHKLSEVTFTYTNLDELIVAFLDAPEHSKKRHLLGRQLREALKKNRPFTIYAMASAMICTCTADQMNQVDSEGKISNSVKDRVAPLVALINRVGHLHVLLHALISEFSCDSNSGAGSIRARHAFNLFTEFIKSINEYPVTTKLAKAVRITDQVRLNSTFEQKWYKLFYRLIVSSASQPTIKLTTELIVQFKSVSPNALDDHLIKRCTQLAVIFHQNNNPTINPNSSTNTTNNVLHSSFDSHVHSVKTVTDLVCMQLN